MAAEPCIDIDRTPAMVGETFDAYVEQMFLELFTSKFGAAFDREFESQSSQRETLSPTSDGESRAALLDRESRAALDREALVRAINDEIVVLVDEECDCTQEVIGLALENAPEIRAELVQKFLLANANSSRIKLKLLGEELWRRERVVFLTNFSCCGNCAWGELGGYTDDLPDDCGAAVGFAGWYTQNGTAEQDQVYLLYQESSPSAPGRSEVNRRVAAIAKELEIDVKLENKENEGDTNTLRFVFENDMVVPNYGIFG